jgi:putative endonuclease
VEIRKMYYVYVLQSQKDGNFYVGFTCDLDRRLKEHNNGENQSTSSGRPFILVYFEVCFDGRDAIHREKYLKTAWGKRYIKGRIKCYLNGASPIRYWRSNGASGGEI